MLHVVAILGCVEVLLLMVQVLADQIASLFGTTLLIAERCLDHISDRQRLLWNSLILQVLKRLVKALDFLGLGHIVLFAVRISS